MTVALTIVCLVVPMGLYLALRSDGATRRARLLGALCLTAAAANWVAAVFTDTLGPSRMIQVGVGVLLVISGAVAIRRDRSSIHD